MKGRRLGMERISTTRCNSVLILICIVILAFLGAFFWSGGQCTHPPIETPSETTYITKTDTIWTSDTVYKTRLVPKETIIHRFDTIRKDTILPIIENKYKDTLICANDTAILGITTRGYEHYVDSISLDLRKSEVTKTITIERTINKQRRWTYGVQSGVGYGVWSKKLDVYVGFGIQYNF